MTEIIIKERITDASPKHGRIPGRIKFETHEGSTFDPTVLGRAIQHIGHVAIATLQTVEKNGKTFINVTGLNVEAPPEVALVPSASVEPPAPRRMNDPTPYLLFDQADDAAIADRVKGKAIEAYVYSFAQQGQTVYGLGVDGAEACKRELARSGELIEEETVTLVKDEPQAAYFEAHASRWALHPKTGSRIKLDTALGFKRQAKVMPTGSLNPFWFEQGTSKALRNAILRLTPEEIKQRVIEAYKTRAKPVKETAEMSAPTPVEASTTPPQEETEKAPIRTLYQEIQDLAASMNIPRGLKTHLWELYVGKGIKPEEADAAMLQELHKHLKHRQQTGEWPQT